VVCRRVQKAARLAAEAAAAPPAAAAALRAKLLARVTRWAHTRTPGADDDVDADAAAPEPVAAVAAPAAPPPAARAAAPPPAQRAPARAPALGSRIDAAHPAEVARRAERESRFAADALLARAPAGPTLQALRASTHGAAAVGTSTALEKTYLRLTAAPEAAAVRPPAVLRQALALVKTRWAAAPDYPRACEQLKAIRQDLTVQHHRGALTQECYATHARIALEARDAAEYAQCAAVLRALHAASPDACSADQAAEFAAYRLLSAAAGGGAAFLDELRSVCARDAAHPFVAHARAAGAAVRARNAVAFFRLYKTAPRMAPYLMDALSAGVRTSALNAALAGYRPGVPTAWLAQQLGFAHAEELTAWAVASGGAVVITDAATGEALLCAPPRAQAAQQQAQQQQQAPQRQQQPASKKQKLSKQQRRTGGVL
jgi:hypothetical protein